LLLLCRLTQLSPGAMSLLLNHCQGHVFAIAVAITVMTGLMLFLPNRNAHKELRIRDGFLIAALFWSVLGLFGSLPFMLASESALTLSDAVFESFAGLTTTGATVITGIEYLTESITYYRQ